MTILILKKNHHRKYLNLGVLLMVFVYVFITVTHILWLPQHNDDSSKFYSHNSIFKRKEISASRALCLMTRMDKSILVEKKNTASTDLAALAGIYLFLAVFFDSFKIRTILRLPDISELFNYKYSYLTFCSFRI